MSLATLSAHDALQQLDRFGTVVDARSPAEFALDHLPGALNWPTLNDDERRVVGTVYKQVGPFDARKLGAAMAARNIAGHIERELTDSRRDWEPLIYCWRGGKRSGSLALVLDQIGFRVTLLEGGYKAFRSALVQDVGARIHCLSLRVICGTTGSGKTRLLQALRTRGAQVIDLEQLACHRSSILGALPGTPQPTQKHFEMRLWDALRRLDPAHPVYIESESRKVGNLTVPEPLVQAMWQSPCLWLQLPQSERVALLLEDYPHWARQPDLLSARLDVLTELKGRAVVQRWQDHLRAGAIAEVVQDLLVQHYDPSYLQSTRRHYQQLDAALTMTPRDRTTPSMDLLAQQLLTNG